MGKSIRSRRGGGGCSERAGAAAAMASTAVAFLGAASSARPGKEKESREGMWRAAVRVDGVQGGTAGAAPGGGTARRPWWPAHARRGYGARGMASAWPW